MLIEWARKDERQYAGTTNNTAKNCKKDHPNDQERTGE